MREQSTHLLTLGNTQCLSCFCCGFILPRMLLAFLPTTRVFLKLQVGKTFGRQKYHSVMNGNKDDSGILSWQKAWASGGICVSPQTISEACSGKVMCTVETEQDLEFKAAVSWLSPLPSFHLGLPKKTPPWLCLWAAVTEFMFPASAIAPSRSVSRKLRPSSGPVCPPS